MLCQSVSIIPTTAPPGNACTVSARTLLGELACRARKTPHAYLIVDDGHGNPIGIVGANDICRRLESRSPAERTRWMRTPVETAIKGHLCFDRIDDGQTKSSVNADLQHCTVVSMDDTLMALVTPQDVLVSWKSIEAMIEQAQKDHVTELPTRAAFDTHLRAECVRGGRDHHSVAVVLVDVDKFKEINDQFGHSAGDAVLKAIGQTLRKTFRSYDMVSRFGGDEFAILCSGCRPGEIDRTIDRVRSGMQKLQFSTSIPRPVPTVSIGACVAHDLDQFDGPDHIIATADECLYFAKRGGRNRSFSTELGVESVAVC
ncbi:MAG: GGDEF domain-containing protein [Planctomycetaceae bacterium]